MADVIITVTDPDTGVSTVFESLQLRGQSDDEATIKKSRPKHHHRGNHKSPSSQAGFIENNNELKPCSYYRQKYCCTGHHELPQDLNSWMNYMAVKKSAGEKVVRKMASQQQQLAADHKRSHALLNAAESEVKVVVLPKKKTMKLQPLNLKPLTTAQCTRLR